MLYIFTKSVKHYTQKNKHKQYLSCKLLCFFFIYARNYFKQMLKR